MAKYGPDRRQYLAVVRDVRTRWNYTHAMIRRAELLQEAIDDWVFKTPGLRALLLSEDEWKTLGEIADILEVRCRLPSYYLLLTQVSQPFTEVTLQMSQSNIPTIPFVLPLYHKMEHLTTISTSWGKSFKIQHAADKGLEKLVKYSFPAKDHHSYIVGTSESFSVLMIRYSEVGFISFQSYTHVCAATGLQPP
ncbi:hypothetical protein BYT27DRAFT_7100375 [Phlegmacium glaucopus]|nr:hypothetical protein BYT27DRAFT_7100375 [Phlegmacium glaucopus]